MIENMNRRDFGRLALALVGAGVVEHVAAPVAAFAQQPATSPAVPAKPGIAIGAWEVQEPPIQMTDAESHEHKGLFSKGIGGIKRGVTASKQKLTNEHFDHLFIKVSDGKSNYYVHAFPVDPISGDVRKFDNLSNAKLRAAVLTEEQHNGAYDFIRQGWKHQFDAQADVAPEDNSGRPLAVTFGLILDVAAAINAAGLDYQPISANREFSPRNDSAAVAAMLSAVGICQPDSCPALESLHKDHLVIGVNRGMIAKGEIKPGTTFTDLAKSGADVATLVAGFNAVPKTPEKKAAPEKKPGLVIK